MLVVVLVVVGATSVASRGLVIHLSVSIIHLSVSIIHLSVSSMIAVAVLSKVG
ncbi:MAG: hypothetical protein ACLP0J_04845 [Solirubrobacteraceae bacterium]